MKLQIKKQKADKLLEMREEARDLLQNEVFRYLPEEIHLLAFLTIKSVILRFLLSAKVTQNNIGALAVSI